MKQLLICAETESKLMDMVLFEFIVGMISVVFALAIAQLFLGISNLVQRRDHVKFFLPHAVWAANLYLLTFLHWWSLWAFRDLPWNFAMFFFSLVGPSLMFFATTVLTPREFEPGTIDLEKTFMNTRRYFLSVVTVMVVLFSLDGPLFGSEPAVNSLRYVQAVITLTIASGIVIDNPRHHSFISIVVLVALLAIVSIRFFPA